MIVRINIIGLTSFLENSMALKRDETSSLKSTYYRKDSNMHGSLPGYLCRVKVSGTGVGSYFAKSISSCSSWRSLRDLSLTLVKFLAGDFQGTCVERTQQHRTDRAKVWFNLFSGILTTRAAGTKIKGTEWQHDLGQRPLFEPSMPPVLLAWSGPRHCQSLESRE